MFRSAYLKLTAFYVAFIMLISLIFSFWVYHEAARELENGLRTRYSQQGFIVPLPQRFLDVQLNQGYQRLTVNLVYFNAAMLLIGAFASYGLARWTMRPIKEAMDAQNRFTADASHELRTPLAAMRTEIEVALRDKSRTKKETHELLESNLEEITRLTQLAEGLLTLAQEQPADGQTETAAYLDQAAAAICERLISLAKAKDVILTCETKEVRVHGDSIILEKLIGIFVDNAIKYSPAGSTVRVDVYKENNRGILRVVDQGVGIEQADIEHIFERFYRADSSRNKDRINGYGLGLSIAKKLIVSLGGHIHVISEPGKGSTFTISLPVA